MENYIRFNRRFFSTRQIQKSKSVDQLNLNTDNVIRDIVYANIDGQSLHLDLYLPRDSKESNPVIVWIHGGDWRGYDWLRGSRESCPIIRMVTRGYAVASIDYRLSSRAKFPAQLDDCKAAIRWLKANARDYKLNEKAIGACGFSGGAMLAALLGTTGNDEQNNGSGGNLEQSSSIQAVVDLFGPTNFLN